MKITKQPLLLFVLLVCISISCSNDDESSDDQMEEMEEIPPEVPRTQIPDAVFEAYLISRDFDDVLDGSVITSNLLSLDNIIVDDLAISDLKGIEDCPNLFNLWLQDCNVSSLDVSRNSKLQFIYFDNNDVSTIDVSNLPLLEKLSGRNNGLNTIDVSSNGELELLEISGNNITNLDVSANTVLFRLDVAENPLVCIQVNEDQLTNENLKWTLDENDTLALDCE